MSDIASSGELAARRQRLSQQMVHELTGFGRWASAMRDFETPYGKAGIRQLEVLYVLRHRMLHDANPTATDLAASFGIQRSVLTRILAKLEAGEYITRETNPSDGRASPVAITEKGRLLSDYVEQEFFREMGEALGEIDAGDVACMEHAMTILRQVLTNLGIRPSVRIDDDR